MATVTHIKGKVTRVVSDTNFFFRASEPAENVLAHINLDGHRAGVEELSAEKLTARSKFRPFKGELPEVGDEVALELVEPFEQ